MKNTNKKAALAAMMCMAMAVPFGANAENEIRVITAGTLNLRADDSIAMPAFTELTKLSEEEFTVVVQNAMAGVEFLQQIFG